MNFTEETVKNLHVKHYRYFFEDPCASDGEPWPCTVAKYDAVKEDIADG